MFWVQLDKQVNEVEQFYKSTNVQANKGCEKPPFSSKKPPLYRGPTSREFTTSEETQEVMRQFSKILHEASASTITSDVSFYLNFTFTEFLNWTWTNDFDQLGFSIVLLITETFQHLKTQTYIRTHHPTFYHQPASMYFD